MNTQEINFAALDGVTITSSVIESSGSGALTPDILLRNAIESIDGTRISDFSARRTFDTFQGREPDVTNADGGIDWYQVTLPQPQLINAIEMGMGFPYRDGGWWTSLQVETRCDEHAPWRAVDNLRVWPEYDFEDARRERRPFESHLLRFDELTAKEIRLIGGSGGSARFTSLSSIRIFYRDFSRWTPPLEAAVPIPYAYKVIDPQTLWDLSENLSKLSSLSIDFPMLEYYLDRPRYAKYWQHVEKNYSGAPELWFLIGDSIGWSRWQAFEAELSHPPTDAPLDPHVQRMLNGIGRAVAPLVVDGMHLGDLVSNWVMIADVATDWGWHRDFAEKHKIDWSDYQAALERSPRISYEQLQAASSLMKLIATTIANLAHTNMALLDGERMDYLADTPTRQRALVQRALDYMKENIEANVTIRAAADHVALSLPYFCTLFTKYTGRNPIEYLTDLKLERAKHYFTYTSMTVMDVCVALDYSPSYFSRLFKKHLNCTPGQYALKVRGAD